MPGNAISQIRTTVLTAKRPRLLLVSNFLSSYSGTRAVTEDLAERLRNSGYVVLCVSSYQSGWIRGIHMLATALLRSCLYDVAVVDLYTGRAFIWGYTLSIVFSILKRPFVLVLHGGDLPDFAQLHPKPVIACLNRATHVTTPSNYLLKKM